jgi:hypothetical protein
MNSVARLLLVVGVLFVCDAHAALSRKPIKDVDVTALTGELQKTAPGDGIHMAWWIPTEFWEASVADDANMSQSDKDELVRVMSKYSLLAVAQADVSRFGTIQFYERSVIVNGMKIELKDGKKTRELQPIDDYPDELGMLLKIMTPMLESALGNTGKNLNFFVLSDESKEGRLISPYGSSILSVTLTDKKGTALEPIRFEMPLDSLYVPRMCPNGKPAHVSWTVCPWDGTKLPN